MVAAIIIMIITKMPMMIMIIMMIVMMIMMIMVLMVLDSFLIGLIKKVDISFIIYNFLWGSTMYLVSFFYFFC